VLKKQILPLLKLVKERKIPATRLVYALDRTPPEEVFAYEQNSWEKRVVTGKLTVEELTHRPLCELCPLERFHRARVRPVGSPEASVLLVGEAPGYEENKQGVPFVGKSGKVLRQLLKKVGYTKKTSRIANTVLCRPPENREPTKQERLCCLPYFIRTISEMPNLTCIVPLGNTALQTISGSTGISSKRGQILKSKWGPACLPTYHPAYALRNPSALQDIEADISYVKNNLQVQQSLDYRVVTTEEDLRTVFEEIKQAKLLAFDVETTGVSFFRDTVIGISFSWAREQGIYIPLFKSKQNELDPLVPFWGPILDDFVRTNLRHILESPVPKAAHNGKFDVLFCKHSLGIEVQNFVFDTMLADHLLSENTRHSLDALSLRYPIRGYKRKIQEALGIGKTDNQIGYEGLPLESIGPYGCADADLTFRLAQDEQIALEKEGLLDIFNNFVMPFQQFLMHIEERGILTNADAIEVAREQLTVEVADHLQKVREVAGDINLRSPKQLRALLYDQLHLQKYLDPTVNVTKKTQQWSTDRATLTVLEPHHPVISSILAYSKVNKLLTTYINPLEKLRDEEGRIHPNFLVHGTVSGRISCKNPNLMNIPKSALIRDIYIPSPGYKFIEVDYHQMEFRILAWLSQDPGLAEVIAQDEDIHSSMASMLFYGKPGHEVTKEQRFTGKSLVFAFCYNGTPEGLAHGVFREHDVGRLKTCHRWFFKRFSTLKSWVGKTVNEIERNLGYTNPFGRRRHLPQIAYLKSSGEDEYQVQAELAAQVRVALNNLVQGTSADFVHRALMRGTEHVKKKFGDDSFFALDTVHDSGLFEVQEKLIDDVFDFLTEDLVVPIDPIDIPVAIDAKILNKWGDPYREEENGTGGSTGSDAEEATNSQTSMSGEGN